MTTASARAALLTHASVCVSIQETWPAHTYITSFGIACITSTHRQVLRSATPPSSSPRVQYDERCDVYSFGLLLWELMHKRVAFEGVGAGSNESHVAIITSCASHIDRPRPHPFMAACALPISEALHVALVLAPASERPPLHLPAGCAPIGKIISACWDPEPVQRPAMSTCAEL